MGDLALKTGIMSRLPLFDRAAVCYSFVNFFATVVEIHMCGRTFEMRKQETQDCIERKTAQRKQKANGK
jgi:hypothetical protein